MGAMLNEEVITRLLEQTVEQLEAGNIDQAQAALGVLEFERLLRPIRGDSIQRQFVDPAAAFGVKRVHETGDYIQSCVRAMDTGDQDLALEAARGAAARWENHG